MKLRALISTTVISLGVGCGPMPSPEPDASVRTDAGVIVDDGGADAGEAADAGTDAGLARPDDPFVDEVVAFQPGPGAGFGQDLFPGVVFGPPWGAGDGMGGLDVLSLGRGGSITLAFTDVHIVDGPGVDFLVFENGFTGFFELAVVEASDNGVDWKPFRCAALLDGGTEGCAGAHVVYANPDAGVSATDPLVAGGDGFDLADVGLGSAHYVRITDTGLNRFYGPPGGGFDLDAVSVVNPSR